jgi:hypothetical protein
MGIIHSTILQNYVDDGELRDYLRACTHHSSDKVLSLGDIHYGRLALHLIPVPPIEC